ncbi:MAG: Piwi domain-containing protein [candidate division WOR-3 bacterium]
MEKKTITLNFLPIENQEFNFYIYYRLPSHSEKKWSEEIRQYKLPDENGKYKHFWVSFEEFENSSKKEISSSSNIELTKFYLFTLLKTKLMEAKINFIQKENERNFAPNHLYIITEDTEWGKKTIRIEPYYLKIKKKFGFLVDYKFLKSHDIPFNRHIQRLSFSLDENYKSNVNFHIDKYDYIMNFLINNLSKFSNIREDIKILNNFEELEYFSLKVKRYIFSGLKEDNSQFNGMMQYGPYVSINNFIKYVYIYHAEHKDYVNDLIKALKGIEYKTFEGLKKLKLPDQTEKNTIEIQIKSFDEDPEIFLSTINKNENPILIVIFPKKEEKFYYTIKNYCLKKDIPLQTVHLETIIDKNKLKWSVSGIALQILAKLGGIPWIVKSENTDCLIVGIGQSIEKDNHNKPIRFIAYAVLLKSSGEFLAIEPLAQTDTKDAYINEISQKIAELLRKYSEYKKVVFHIPEKIKFATIKTIEDVLKNHVKDIELYIIRVNDDSKFFGYDINNNSLIPYESSYIQLSHKEFLLWTEGLNYHNPTPRKRYSNPIYIDFYYSNQDRVDYKLFLQDILNLSGANYRGFNAKSLPVSMFYPKLISSFYKHFKKYGLALNIEKKNKMWFL